MTDLPLLRNLGEQPKAARSTSTKMRTAEVIAFPPHRDQKLVAKLIDRYLGLVKRHGDKAYIVFRDWHESPIIARLMRYGMTLEEARAEIGRVHHAMAALSLRRKAERETAQVGGRPA